MRGFGSPARMKPSLTHVGVIEHLTAYLLEFHKCPSDAVHLAPWQSITKFFILLAQRDRHLEMRIDLPASMRSPIRLKRAQHAIIAPRPSRSRGIAAPICESEKLLAGDGSSLLLSAKHVDVTQRADRTEHGKFFLVALKLLARTFEGFLGRAPRETDVGDPVRWNTGLECVLYDLQECSRLAGARSAQADRFRSCGFHA